MSDFLKTQIASMGIEINDNQLSQFSHMLDLLAEWNQLHNLTRLKDRREQEIYHILDALSALKYFHEYNTVLDVGTGAGFPGVPLAIMCPEKHFHLVDSNGKKTAYLKQLVQHLNLNNVTVYHARAESLNLKDIDCVTARAVANPDVIINLTKSYKPKMYLLYIGPNCPDMHNANKIQLTVPFSEKKHYLFLLEQSN